MTLRTAFTDLLSVEHPIGLAPMNGSAGGPWPPPYATLAASDLSAGAANSRPGRRSVSSGASSKSSHSPPNPKPWGIGFITWALEPAILEQVLSHRPAAVMLSMGDPAPFAERVHQAGACLVVQATDLDEARQALEVGADVVVAQGSEAGGHGGRR